LIQELVVTDDNASKPAARKAPIAALAGSGVAIGAALLAVFISTSSNKDKTDSVVTDGGEMVSVQSAGTDGAPQAPPATPDTPATDGVTASADGAISYSDASLTFSAALPPGAETDPVLAPLRKQALEMLAEYKKNAAADLAERKRMGAVPMTWELQVNWKQLAKAGNIVSLEGTIYEFTGGAHGMGTTAGHIARADTGEELTFQSMLVANRAPSPALTIAICEALKTEKMARIQSATIYDEPIVCAGPTANLKAEEASYALAPSNEAGKFGGLYVFYDAYAVGSYAEGAYALTIPQQVFAEDLKPEFKALFAGAAPKAPNPT
jgi:Deacetylase PdaC